MVVLVAEVVPLAVMMAPPPLAPLALAWILVHLVHHPSLLAGLGHLVPGLRVAAHWEAEQASLTVPAAGLGYSAALEWPQV